MSAEEAYSILSSFLLGVSAALHPTLNVILFFAFLYYDHAYHTPDLADGNIYEALPISAAIWQGVHSRAGNLVPPPLYTVNQLLFAREKISRRTSPSRIFLVANQLFYAVLYEGRRFDCEN
jgi:hypothetical protein